MLDEALLLAFINFCHRHSRYWNHVLPPYFNDGTFQLKIYSCVQYVTDAQTDCIKMITYFSTISHDVSLFAALKIDWIILDKASRSAVTHTSQPAVISQRIQRHRDVYGGNLSRSARRSIVNDYLRVSIDGVAHIANVCSNTRNMVWTVTRVSGLVAPFRRMT